VLFRSEHGFEGRLHALLGVLLDLDLDEGDVAQRIQRLIEGRNSDLLGPVWKGCTGVHLGQLPRGIVRDRTTRRGCAVNRGVVDHHRHVVARHVHIELHRVETQTPRVVEPCNRVLGHLTPGATMTYELKIRHACYPSDTHDVIRCSSATAYS